MSWQRSILIAAVLLFAAVYYGLAFIAIRDLARRPVGHDLNKTTWALIILCVPIGGALLYGYMAAASLVPRQRPPAMPEFTPFDHLFEDEEGWTNLDR